MGGTAAKGKLEEYIQFGALGMVLDLILAVVK
jgi:hypothetical protein